MFYWWGLPFALKGRGLTWRLWKCIRGVMYFALPHWNFWRVACEGKPPKKREMETPTHVVAICFSIFSSGGLSRTFGWFLACWFVRCSVMFIFDIRRQQESTTWSWTPARWLATWRKRCQERTKGWMRIRWLKNPNSLKTYRFSYGCYHLEIGG